jgi:hypothetical protein
VTALDLLAQLRRRGINLEIRDENLLIRAPHGALTPQLHTEVERHKTEIIAFLRDVRLAAAASAPRLDKRPPGEAAVLSFAQQRLWFLDRLQPGSPVYNVAAAFRIRGPLAPELLRQALAAILDRHDVFRTSFLTVGGEPALRIESRVEISLPMVDLASIPLDLRAGEVVRQARDEVQAPLDLETAPLLRVKLLRLDNADHVLILTTHHIVCDGWSLDLLLKELWSTYSRLREGTPLAPGPELAYADYAQWQRQWLRGEVLERQLSYWRERLKGAPPALDLPTDHPRPTLQSGRGNTVVDELSDGTIERVRSLCLELQVTPFVVYFAAFVALLHRFCRQEDICIGTPIANRRRPELENLIGYFANTLVLRTRVDPRARFVEIVRQVAEVARDAYLHQDVPFEHLVMQLNPDRLLSYSPLFQVMFVVQNAPSTRTIVAGLEIEDYKLEVGTSRFDLVLSATERGDTLVVHLDHSLDLFETETAKRLLRHYLHLLESAVRAPETRVAALPLLSEEEARTMLFDWNRTRRDYPQLGLHQLIEQQVDRSPDAVAVLFGDKQMRYMELDRRANQLAHYLRGLGVREETLVAICADRSLDLLVGILGVLKAGAAYVPLDPEYPRERISYMLEDTKAPIVLTHSEIADRLPSSGQKVILLDRMSDVASSWASSRLDRRVLPEQLAYVI